MKIIDVPQSGKLGVQVAFRGRNGLIRRAFVVPRNPKTLEQTVVRSNFLNIGKRYDTLTEAQQDAWSAAAANIQTRPTLGQSGPMTGLQLFQKINASLASIGGEQVDAPPALPTFPDNPFGALTITNVGGVIAISLATTGTPGGGTTVRGAAPQRSGVRSEQNFRLLGASPAPVANKCDITALYTARFGVPTVGSRIFIRTNQNVDGWQDGGYITSALVPEES